MTSALGGQVAPGEPSLEEVVKLLAVARRFFGFAGTAFLLWKVDEVFRRKEKATLVDAVVEVALVSVIGPGLVWATSKWGERLARQANQSHEELVILNKLAQQEIAERVRIEAELAEANTLLECRVAERTQELTELNEALKREMTERLRAETALVEQEKLAATGRMAAQMAHEISNPLAGIKNAFRLIRYAIPEDHPDVRYVALIEREIDRIARIVHETLDLYRQHPEPPRLFRVDRAVREVAELLEPLSRASEIGVSLELPDESIEATLPEGPVHQILFNLLKNALEASPAHGCVAVALAADADGVSLSVRDEGAGIPEGLRARVFEPFFTTKARSDSGGGLGLGLSVSRSLARAMGGDLTFESEAGAGTRFTVSLPVAIERMVGADA